MYCNDFIKYNSRNSPKVLSSVGEYFNRLLINLEHVILLTSPTEIQEGFPKHYYQVVKFPN